MTEGPEGGQGSRGTSVKYRLVPATGTNVALADGNGMLQEVTVWPDISQIEILTQII